MKNTLHNKIRGAVSILTAVIMAAAVPFCAFADESVTVIEYDDLSDLLRNGNYSLVMTKVNQDLNVAPYEEMYQTLKDEQTYMQRMANSYKDDGDTEMQEFYQDNADALKKSAGQVYSMIDSMKNSTSQEKSFEKQVNTLTVSAQSLMNSYNQLVENLKSQELLTQAAQSTYDMTVLKRASGMATDDDVASALNSLNSRKNSLASMQDQADQLKKQLCTMVGITDADSVTIGAIPDPDIDAIYAIDFDADLEIAISNDSSWVSAMTSKVKGSDNRELRDQKREEAAANEEISLTSTYDSLMISLAKYEAAKKTFAAATADYEALCQKKELGLLNSVDWLNGEATYAAAEATMNIASMNLQQSYETYKWEVKGTV